MGFNIITPAQAVRASSVTATLLAQTKRYKTQKLLLNFPSTICGIWDKFDKVEVLLGDGDDHGKVMVKPSKEGHALAALKHCRNVRIDLQPSWNKSDFSTEFCEYKWDNNACVVTLPARLFEDAKAQIVPPELKKSDAVLSHVRLTGQTITFKGKSALITNKAQLEVFHHLHQNLNGWCTAKEFYVDYGIATDQLERLIAVIRKQIAPLRLTILENEEAYQLREPA